MRLYPGLLVMFAVLATGQAYGGAWTQDAGKSQLIMTSQYYSADERWDDRSRKQLQSTYDKYELNPYYEYGWRDGLTFGANLSLQRAQQDGIATTATKTSWGIGDSEFFMRKRLWQRGSFIASSESLVKIPSFFSTGDNNPRIGSSRPDIGTGLSGGYSFKLMGHDGFADIDTQYRYRFGKQKDQLKLSATAGLHLSDKWMVMPQVFQTYRVTNPTTVTFTQSANDDYNLTRLQLSAVYKLRDDVSLQLGGFSDISGKNAGVGRGVLVALWKSL